VAQQQSWRCLGHGPSSVRCFSIITTAPGQQNDRLPGEASCWFFGFPSDRFAPTPRKRRPASPVTMAGSVCNRRADFGDGLRLAGGVTQGSGVRSHLAAHVVAGGLTQGSGSEVMWRPTLWRAE
jgi:hypothetical protein